MYIRACKLPNHILLLTFYQIVNWRITFAVAKYMLYFAYYPQVLHGVQVPTLHCRVVALSIPTVAFRNSLAVIGLKELKPG